jgi:hypothetical protein
MEKDQGMQHVLFQEDHEDILDEISHDSLSFLRFAGSTTRKTESNYVQRTWRVRLYC